MENAANKPFYIVVSQTGTLLSRIIKAISHKEYNHASISFYEDLHIMYSFGRKRPYNPIFGGFVRESAEFGTFKRFSNTEIIVLKLLLTEQEFDGISRSVNKIAKHQSDYGYNYLGLCLAAFNICFKKKDRFYCSEFVKKLLVENGIYGADKLEDIIHPMSFLNMPNTETVYCGKLTDYSVKENIMA